MGGSRWSRASVAPHYNPAVRLQSSAPTRIDLAGGTLDIWPLYLLHEGVQTVNAAITLRASCTVASCPGGGLRLAARDTGATADVAKVGELDDAHPALRLPARILRFFRASGVAVETRSDSPVGAGLAGSSALNVALCAAIARWQDRRLEPEALLNLARDIEVQVIGVPTGGQDYRPAFYGGIAAIEFGPAGVHRVPLDVPPRALEERMVVVYTGQSRDSGINNWEVTKRRIDGDASLAGLFDEIRDTASRVRAALKRSDWTELARSVGHEWELRKRLAPGVTTEQIDILFRRAFDAGADAGKVCGAGGGGCVFFLAEPDATASVRRALNDAGARLLDCGIDTEGLRLAVR